VSSVPTRRYSARMSGESTSSSRPSAQAPGCGPGLPRRRSRT
jgi:hypothetical protein